MIRIRPWIFFAALAASLSFTSSAQGASINVLWYTYADLGSEYRRKISQLSEIVHTLPQTDGLSWNLTYWDAGSEAPDLAAFDVLVIESGEAFLTGSANGPPAVPDYIGILDSRAAIEAARGDRTFITAADADFHAIRGDTGNTTDDPRSSNDDGKCAPPFTSIDCWDGALGHLVNAVNWAGSGNGLGIVSFLDGEHPGSFWWTHENSFLRSDLDGYVDYAGSEQNPVINPLQASHPLNRGLSSRGLSNWSTSFHAFFLPIEGYTPIVDSSQRPGWAVAIATSIAPPLPEPKIYKLQGGLCCLSAVSADVEPMTLKDTVYPLENDSFAVSGKNHPLVLTTESIRKPYNTMQFPRPLPYGFIIIAQPYSASDRIPRKNGLRPEVPHYAELPE